VQLHGLAGGALEEDVQRVLARVARDHAHLVALDRDGAGGDERVGGGGGRRDERARHDAERDDRAKPGKHVEIHAAHCGRRRARRHRGFP
jgi:hypothetical protein